MPLHLILPTAPADGGGGWGIASPERRSCSKHWGPYIPAKKQRGSGFTHRVYVLVSRLRCTLKHNQRTLRSRLWCLCRREEVSATAPAPGPPTSICAGGRNGCSWMHSSSSSNSSSSSSSSNHIHRHTHSPMLPQSPLLRSAAAAQCSRGTVRAAYMRRMLQYFNECARVTIGPMHHVTSRTSL